MDVNQPLLEKLSHSVQTRLGSFLNIILTASAEHGPFGMQLVDALHGELSGTTCENCGSCCNSISLFSLEYHFIMRDLLTRFPPPRLRELLTRVLRVDQRLAVAETEQEKRVRCAFRDDEQKVCLIHPVRPFPCRLFGMLKEDGTRDCPRVKDLMSASPTPFRHVEQLQTKIMDNSESFEVYPGKPAIAFFPFEFWIFRYALGPQKALEIYREILVPASTPLTKFWADSTTFTR